MASAIYLGLSVRNFIQICSDLTLLSVVQYLSVYYFWIQCRLHSLSYLRQGGYVFVGLCLSVCLSVCL